MINVTQILNEAFNLYECQVLLKTQTAMSKTDIFNQIRAISGVVVVHVIQNDFLDSKRTKHHEYSLISMKYVVDKSPEQDIKAIGSRCLQGDQVQFKIPGLISFLPRLRTIIKKGVPHR